MTKAKSDKAGGKTAADLPTETLSAGGREISIRGLTRKEIRKMSTDGLNPGQVTLARSEEAMDHVLGRVLGKADLDFLDDQLNAESIRVYRRILDLTYGRADEEKNS